MALGLQPLTSRDAGVRNIAEVLAFARPPNLAAPKIAVSPVVPVPCAAPAGVSPESEWTDLRALALQHGWSIS